MDQELKSIQCFHENDPSLFIHRMINYCFNGVSLLAIKTNIFSGQFFHEVYSKTYNGILSLELFQGVVPMSNNSLHFDANIIVLKLYGSV